MKSFSLGSLFVAASMSLGVLTASPAYADPPECTANMFSFEAVLCASAPEPIRGAFGTWKNVPIAYSDEAYAGTWTRNSVIVEPADDYSVVIGLEVVAEGDGQAKYGPFWQETSPNGSEYQAIAHSRGPAWPDESTNTYMLMKTNNGGEWNVLYNFNHVDTTTLQPDNDVSRLDASILVFDPGNTNVPRIDNRVQYMSGNLYWSRFNRSSVAANMSAPRCGTAGSIEHMCFNSVLRNYPQDRTKLGYWRLDKPGPSTAVAAPSAAPNEAGAGQESSPTSSTASTDTIHGVDQELLAACMQNTADQCLQQVPNLAECVAEHSVCNTNTNSHTHSFAASALTADTMTAEQISSRVQTRFDAKPSDINLEPTDVSLYENAYGVALTPWEPSAPLWLVTVAGTVTDDAGRTFHGLHAAYDARSGQLVHSCIGNNC